MIMVRAKDGAGSRGRASTLTVLSVMVYAILLAPLAGCGGNGRTDTPPPTRSPTVPSLPSEKPPGPHPATLPAIGYARTGGIAGVQDNLRITPSGHVTAATNSIPERRGVLTSAERADLLAAVRAVDLTRASSSHNGRAADTFQYVITIGDRAARFDELTLPKQLSALISVLNGIISRVCA